MFNFIEEGNMQEELYVYFYIIPTTKEEFEEIKEQEKENYFWDSL